MGYEKNSKIGKSSPPPPLLAQFAQADIGRYFSHICTLSLLFKEHESYNFPGKKKKKFSVFSFYWETFNFPLPKGLRNI